MRSYQYRCVPTATAIMAIAVWGINSGNAQDGHDHSHDGHNHTKASPVSHEHSKETLAFRLADWKQLHFDDSTKAQQHVETVTKLGCEVKQGNHAGHIDVGYRCAEWKSIELENHDLAQQWQGWLEAAGFDVSHGHLDNGFSEGPEVVKFRLTEWKSLHGEGTPGEQTFIDTLKKVGCDVRVAEHKGHSDIRFRAPMWRDIHVADHAAANQWTEWFKANGFETSHEQ
jgi:hypothetical protein